MKVGWLKRCAPAQLNLSFNQGSHGGCQGGLVSGQQDEWKARWARAGHFPIKCSPKILIRFVLKYLHHTSADWPKLYVRPNMPKKHSNLFAQILADLPIILDVICQKHIFTPWYSCRLFWQSQAQPQLEEASLTSWDTPPSASTLSLCKWFLLSAVI